MICLEIDFHDPEQTAVVSYERSGKPIWTTHPIEKPYLIYQIGSATPKLAVQAALTVVNDVSGMHGRVNFKFNARLLT